MKQLLFLTVCLIISLPTKAQSFIRSELPTQLNYPWEITYGPDDFLWLTESGGNVIRVNPENGDKTTVYTAPDYFVGSPLEASPLCPELSIGSGTHGLALHPDFLSPESAFIYFIYSYNSGTPQAPATKFRIKRLKWNAQSQVIESDTNIVNQITTGYDHLGGRLMTIEQNGIPYLFLSIGDNGRSEQNSPECYSPQSTNPNNFTQDVTRQNGKIHRFHLDGSIPSDNPIEGNSFYTRGHRNPQGLMYNKDLDIIYSIEHGDRTDDEINILLKGMNYGWKNVRGYHNDNSFPGEAEYVANYTPHPLIPNDALVEPFYSWCTTPDSSSNYAEWCTVAPSDGIYYGSNGIPQWTNSLLVVTLKDGLTTDKEVYQFKLQANGELEPSTSENPNPRKFFGEDQAQNGRLRDIAVSKDGKKIYLINNGGATDKITVYQYDSTASSIDQNLENLQLQLFPNPTSDYLTIKGLENSVNIKMITISTIHGKSRIVELDQDNRIDVSELSIGMHLIHILLDGGSFTLKFMKI